MPPENDAKTDVLFLQEVKRPPDIDICDWMRLWQVFNDRLSCTAIWLGWNCEDCHTHQVPHEDVEVPARRSPPQKARAKTQQVDLQPHHSGSNLCLRDVILLFLPRLLLHEQEAVLMEKPVWQRMSIACQPPPRTLSSWRKTVRVRAGTPLPKRRSQKCKASAFREQERTRTNLHMSPTQACQSPAGCDSTGNPLAQLRLPPAFRSWAGRTGNWNVIFTPVSQCASELQPRVLRALLHIIVLCAHCRLRSVVCSLLQPCSKLSADVTLLSVWAWRQRWRPCFYERKRPNTQPGARKNSISKRKKPPFRVRSYVTNLLGL